MKEYLSVIFALCFVLLLLFLTTKILAAKSKNMLKGKYMQIIETLNLGVNNRLHLIKVDKEFFVISATNKSVEFLARVNINDFQEVETKSPIADVIDFKAILKKNLNGFKFINQTAKKDADTERAGTAGIYTATAEEKAAEKAFNHIQNDSEEAVFRRNLSKLRDLTNSMDGKRSRHE